MLEPQTGIPLHPVDTPPAAPRRDGADGALRYQRCTHCGTANFTPTELCRGCASRSLEWRASAGLGTVHSWTEVHRPAAPPGAATPYAVAIVDLDDGYRMLTNLIGIESHPVREGLRVRIDPHGAGGEHVLPYFRPQFPPPVPPSGDAASRPAPGGFPLG
ncbi:OB-fold domain-containing protein [Yinghuangia sp. ASG 101]|uniref:Zn-ribbon domain-containing OB-fold protein n=1 Tax=Yinghuangia sp. ASG 101 TaxID=2896848 RepID=UPI001E2B9289|nr:OB-fold domain-containing protein [Yinghuangia sp. ASG 101]UGQ15588.1 OB-fold domain-containing protein [Yinghuangia sp. ASG 101]